MLIINHMEFLVVFINDIENLYKKDKVNAPNFIFARTKNNDLVNKKVAIEKYNNLIKKAINLKVKNENLLIEPNYRSLNYILKLYFKHNEKSYKIVVDGLNKSITVGGIKLVNINKIALKYLKLNE